MGITVGAKSIVGKAAAGTSAVAVGYWKGLTYPFRGAKLVYWKHPGLIRFWIFPILITGLLISSACYAGRTTHEAVATAVWTDPTEQTQQRKELPDSGKDKPARKHIEAGTDWLAQTGHWVHSAFEILILLLVLSVAILAAVVLTNVIAAPFNDFLSEEVERIQTGRAGPPFSLKVILRDTVRTVGLEIVKLGVYLLIMIPLFLLSTFLPVVGQVIYSIFGFVFTAIYFSIDYIDWPASRRNRSMSYRFSLVTDHFMPMFGFGTGVWVFLFIPLVNLLFMPAAVAGGTMLFLDLEGSSRAS